MSNIVINEENFKRFSKRLQKNSENYGLKLSLAESQELLAKTIGSSNLHEIKTLLNQERNSKEEDFVAKYKEIINNDTAVSKSYIYVDCEEIIIDIVGQTEDDTNSVFFGSEKITNLDDFISIGISKETSKKLVEIFNEYNPVEKYAGLLFGSNVRKIMIKEQGSQNVNYFKNNLFSHEKNIEGIIYSKRYMVVTDKRFKSIVEKLHSSGVFCVMTSGRYAGYDEKEIALDQIIKNDSIAIEYYYELHSENPKCLMSQFWTSIDGVIQEYTPADYKLDLHS